MHKHTRHDPLNVKILIHKSCAYARRVADLKELCRACGQPVSGTKAVLVARLLAHALEDRPTAQEEPSKREDGARERRSSDEHEAAAAGERHASTRVPDGKPPTPQLIRVAAGADGESGIHMSAYLMTHLFTQGSRHDQPDVPGLGSIMSISVMESCKHRN